MLSCDFKGFLAFLAFLHIKVAQTRFVSHETWHTTLFGIYFCVEVVRVVTHSHILEITCEVAILSIFSGFCTFAHKAAQTWFFCTKLGTQHYLVYIIVLKWLEV